METKNRIKLEVSLNLGKKTEIKTKKIFYGSVFFIFLSVSGTLAAWLFKLSWQKITSRLKIAKQSLAPKFSSQGNPLRTMFLLVALNLSFWGWLNKEDVFLIYQPIIKEIRAVSFPIALGKMEEGVILGSADAVKIDDLQKESLAGNPGTAFLGEGKNLDLPLTQERCQKNISEKKSSEMCGEDPQDEELEKELAKLDYSDKLKIGNNVKKTKKINAPSPYISETDNLGRKVCNKSNDKPSKSNKGKGKHMDMECCLDPDEYPNPHCYYSTAKYGKYL